MSSRRDSASNIRLRLFTLAVFTTASIFASSTASQATTAREENRLDDAIKLYRVAVQEDSKWTEGWWYLGTLLYDRDDFAGAAPAFQKASELDPRAGTSWAMLGLCEAKLGRTDDALKHLEHARRLGVANDPQLRHVMLFTEASLRLARGNDRDDFEGAQDSLDALVRDGEESDEVVRALGLAVLRMKPPGSNAQLIHDAGQAEALAAKRGHPEEALAAYEHLCENHPRTPNVQFALGNFLMTRGFDDRAVEAFQKELVLTPEYLLARLGIAGILWRSDPAAALPYAAAATKQAPYLPEAHYLWGVSLVGVGKLTEGIEQLEIAKRGAPTESKIYFALGKAYARAKRPEDAARARAEFQRLDSLK